MDFNSKYQDLLREFNSYLKNKLNNLDKSKPKIIIDAINYAIDGGGKRVRPILCLATNELLGGKNSDVLVFCVAIEMIHSYSLVHDDLPAMDNDDYRRGKLSTHKKFGEAYGILTGDALLNLAFETALNKQDITNNDIRAIQVIGECAGYKGMISGQVLDLDGENKEINEKMLYDIYTDKTAKLITAPLLVASIVNGNKYYDELSEYGYHLGILFQIVDDILDEESDLQTLGKTPHKDLEENKLTSIKVFTLNGAKERAKFHYEKSMEIIKKIDKDGFLTEFTENMYNRKK